MLGRLRRLKIERVTHVTERTFGVEFLLHERAREWRRCGVHSLGVVDILLAELLEDGLDHDGVVHLAKLYLFLVRIR